MNANDQFFARDAHVDDAAVQPLPNSRKIYVEGSRADVRVPMREIAQADTPASFGAEVNPPLAVYDTSGPYTDPTANIDIRSGVPRTLPATQPVATCGRVASSSGGGVQSASTRPKARKRATPPSGKMLRRRWLTASNVYLRQSALLTSVAYDRSRRFASELAMISLPCSCL